MSEQLEKKVYKEAAIITRYDFGMIEVHVSEEEQPYFSWAAHLKPAKEFKGTDAAAYQAASEYLDAICAEPKPKVSGYRMGCF